MLVSRMIPWTATTGFQLSAQSANVSNTMRDTYLALAMFGTIAANGDECLARWCKGKVVNDHFDRVRKAQAYRLAGTEEIPEIDAYFQVLPGIRQTLDVVGNFSVDSFLSL